MSVKRATNGTGNSGRITSYNVCYTKLLRTDANGCSRVFTALVTLTEPAVITVTVNTINDVSCPGGSDGSVLITPAGGTPGYTFSWAGNTSGYTSAAEDPVNMPADTYDLTITDANGCSQFFNDLLTVAQPAPITVTVDGTTRITSYNVCYTKLLRNFSREEEAVLAERIPTAAEAVGSILVDGVVPAMSRYNRDPNGGE